MTKVNIIPGPTLQPNKDGLSHDNQEPNQPLSDTKNNQENNQEKQSEIPPERILVWRCLCGAEVDCFGKEYTSHIKQGREAGEDHKWRLVDKDTGEIIAENMKVANIMGLKATRGAVSPKLGGGSSSKKKDKDKTDEDDSTPWKPRSPLVAKWVAATDELPAELLLLYKLFCDKCIAAGMMPPTRGEWITQSISQFYLEHADDFDLRGMAAEFISKVAGGQDEQGT